MKKNLKEYVIVLSVIVLVGLLLIVVKNKIVSFVKEIIDEEWQTGYDEGGLIIEDNTNYGISYYYNGNSYDISIGDAEDYIYVKQEIMFKCLSSISADCPESVINNFKVKFEYENMKKAKDLIINLNTRYSNETIYYEDLTDEELMVINAITHNDESYFNTTVKYRISNKNSIGKLKNKGYILKKYNNYSTVEIGIGEQSNSGYDIEIKEVKKINDNIYIVVNEVKPNPEDNYMTVITSPSIIIDIYESFNNVIVKNNENILYQEISN